MAMKIPPDAKVVRESRIDLIRILSTLQDRFVEPLKARVKATLQEKDAQFAESDLVIAALRAATPRQTIDARKLYALVESGKLPLKAFLACITVQKKPLEEHLSGKEIEKLSEPGPTPEPALFTEFKPGVQIDFAALADRLAAAIETLSVVQ